MTGDCHVRFYQGLGVKLPRPTNLTPRNTYGIGVNSVNQWLANFHLPNAKNSLTAKRSMSVATACAP
jgi:hypothetical protein